MKNIYIPPNAEKACFLLEEHRLLNQQVEAVEEKLRELDPKAKITFRFQAVEHWKKLLASFVTTQGCLRQEELRAKVSPNHPDVYSWDEQDKYMSKLTEQERQNYNLESLQIWEKFDDGPPRMVRTFLGNRVVYPEKP